MKKSLVQTALAAVMVFVVSYALAASMNITGINFLGGGEASVTVPVSVQNIDWVLQRQGNRWVVTGVQVYFNASLPSGSTVYVSLIGSGDTEIAAGNTTLANPSQIVTVNTDPNVRAQDIVKVAVAVRIPAQ